MVDQGRNPLQIVVPGKAGFGDDEDGGGTPQSGDHRAADPRRAVGDNPILALIPPPVAALPVAPGPPACRNFPPLSPAGHAPAGPSGYRRSTIPHRDAPRNLRLPAGTENPADAAAFAEKRIYPKVSVMARNRHQLRHSPHCRHAVGSR